MGNSQSTDAELKAAQSFFTPQELSQTLALFRSLAAQSRSHGQYIIASVFVTYYGIHGSIGARLFDLITEGQRDNEMRLPDLLKAKAKYEKGSPEEVDEFVYNLADLTGDGAISRQELESVIASILVTVFGPDSPTPDSFTSALLDSASFPLQIPLRPLAPPPTAPAAPRSRRNLHLHIPSHIRHLLHWDTGLDAAAMGVEEFRQWGRKVSAVRRVLGALLADPRAGTPPGRLIPELSLLEGGSDGGAAAGQPGAGAGAGVGGALLSPWWAWFIAGGLQERQGRSWSRLYSSSAQGLSFSTLMGRVGRFRGPSVLLVRDTEGAVFGGFASQPWERRPDFFGDMKSFVFTLAPSAAIYRPSGANANIQWFASGFQSDQIPNGLGFGGQPHHFGLFLDSSLEAGHSFEALTFDSPGLASAPRFRPDVVEIWGVNTVSDGVTGTGSVSAAGASVLDRFKEERALMGFMGMANSSDNVARE